MDFNEKNCDSIFLSRFKIQYLYLFINKKKETGKCILNE